jgi:preprotein translocase subunit SecG
VPGLYWIKHSHIKGTEPNMLNGLIMFLLLATSIFLVLLVLVQRGRGGGLAGAFGGLGGQSAFGTKAGDLFTRITIVVAAFWILLCAASVKYFSDSNRGLIAPNIGKNSATDSTPGTAGGTKSAPAKSSATPGTPAAVPASSGPAPAGGGTSEKAK